MNYMPFIISPQLLSSLAGDRITARNRSIYNHWNGQEPLKSLSGNYFKEPKHNNCALLIRFIGVLRIDSFVRFNRELRKMEDATFPSRYLGI